MFNILVHYGIWHYTRAWADITRIFVSILEAVSHFFSIGLLLRTFFSPFRRIKTHYKGGLSLEDLASTLVTNLLMRLVGVVLRTVIIITGISALLVALFMELLFYLLWLVLPFVLVYLFIYSLILFFA